MASDPIDHISKEESPSGDEKNAEHVEISQDDPKLESGSSSEEWHKPKPKLNLQMALAFVVSLSLNRKF